MLFLVASFSVLTMRPKFARADGPGGSNSGGAGGGSAPESGCKYKVVGNRVTVQGDCYTSLPWDENTSVELHGTVWADTTSTLTHLSEGKARVFNLGHNVGLRVQVDGNPNEMVASPRNIVEISYGEDTDGAYAAVYSDEGSTSVAVGYSPTAIELKEGEGQKFYFENNTQASACSAARSSVVIRNQRSAPLKDGGWAMYVMTIVLVIARRITKRGSVRTK